MRKHSFFLAAITALLFSSCDKQVCVEPTPDPEPASAFTRTIMYTNRGTVNEAAYDAAFKMEARAVVENNELLVAFIAGGKTPGSVGDAIAFRLQPSSGPSNPVKTYRFNAPADAIRYARYTHTQHDADGSIRGSITDSEMGVRFEGFLKVESYDAARKLISGTYQAEIKGLISDPLKSRTSGPIDPMDQCDVTISGSFRNVKVQNL